MDTENEAKGLEDGIFQSLLDNAADAVVLIDHTKSILFWNKAAERLWGYSREETLGKNINQFVPTEHKASHNEYVDSNLRTGVNKVIGMGRELELERKNGDRVPILLTLSKLTKGGDTYYMAVVKDISIQKEASAGLEALQHTVDTSFARIEFDTMGNILTANQNFAKTMGYKSPDEFIGQHHAIFVEDGYRRSANYRQFWEELAVGKVKDGEFERIAKDGTSVWIQAAYTPVRDSRGNVYKIIKIATDITEQKLRNLNAEALKQTLDASFARIEFDPYGNILDTNQNFTSTLGYIRAEDLIGKHHSTFVEQAYKNSPDYTKFWEDLRAGKQQEGEFMRITRDGAEVWILAAYTPVTNENGEVIKVIKIASDITKQKEIVKAVNKVVAEAGNEGRLDARVEMAGAEGDWGQLVNSVNMLLESIATPILEVSRIINEMADGNLTERFELEAEGDVKVLGESLNTANQSLNTLLSNTAQIADLLAASSEEMLTKGEEMQNTTKEVAAATQQMAEGAQQQAQQTDGASTQMEQLLQSANEMQENAKRINLAAKDGQISATEGLTTLKLMVENMAEIQGSATSTTKSINILAERSEEIASTLSVITDIAAQTNLLALNAAIEAARAGDAGRGFAVVAEEIRKLAEGSRKSAINIEKIIREVQKDITGAAKAIESMENSVKSGSKASQEAEEVFQKIEVSNNETFNLSEGIVGATNEQKEAIDATVQNIEKIVVVSEETASGTEQIASSSKVLSQGMNEVTATSNDLADVALQLQENISKFKLR